MLSTSQHQAVLAKVDDSDFDDDEFAALAWLATLRLRSDNNELIDERWLGNWWSQRAEIELTHLHPSRVDLTLTAKHLGRDYCQLHQLLLVGLTPERATLVFAQPPAAEQLQLLSSLFARELQIKAIYAYQWRSYFRSSFSIQRSFKALGGSVYSSQKRELALPKSQQSDSDQVITLVDWLFEYVASRLISDVHIEARARSCLVRVRVDGQLQDLITIPTELAGRIGNRLKVLAGMELVHKRVPQDGRFTLHSSNGELLQVRMAAVSSNYGEKIALRFFHEKLLFEQIEQLGMSQGKLAGWQDLLKSNSGLILITGPTGSGKTTTLYASLLELANRGLNVATIEDPIELAIDSFTQIQVNSQFNYDAAIKSLLRQDPDVIMVGEARDSHTAQAAVQAAQTGHLVFVTVHSSDCIGAVVRLLDLGVPWYLLQESLLGVLAQRLLPLLCQNCQQPYQSDELASWQQRLQLASTIELHRSLGCESCRMQGIAGRKAIFELLNFGASLQQLSDFRPQSLASYSCGDSLRAAGLQLALSASVSPEAILSLTPEQRSYWR